MGQPQGAQAEFELRHWDGSSEADEYDDQIEKDSEAQHEQWQQVIADHQNECLHPDVECETILVCSQGCTCGCVDEMDEETVAMFIERAKAQIVTVLDKYEQDFRTHDGPFDEWDNLKKNVLEAAGLGE